MPPDVARHVWVTLIRLANEAKERGASEASLLHRGHWTEVGQWLMERLESLPGRHNAHVRLPKPGDLDRMFSYPCWCARGEDHEFVAEVAAVTG